MSFLQDLVEAYNSKGVKCRIEATNFKGEEKKQLYISIDVRAKNKMGTIKINLEKFSKSFGKMLLMNGGDINSTCSEFLIILKKLAENGMIKLFDEQTIDETKIID